MKVAFDGALEGALVSATEDALEGRSEGAPKSVLRDPYKDVPESSFEVELKGALYVALEGSPKIFFQGGT